MKVLLVNSALAISDGAFPLGSNFLLHLSIPRNIADYPSLL